MKGTEKSFKGKRQEEGGYRVVVGKMIQESFSDVVPVISCPDDVGYLSFSLKSRISQQSVESDGVSPAIPVFFLPQSRSRNIIL